LELVAGLTLVSGLTKVELQLAQRRRIRLGALVQRLPRLKPPGRQPPQPLALVRGAGRGDWGLGRERERERERGLGREQEREREREREREPVMVRELLAVAVAVAPGIINGLTY